MKLRDAIRRAAAWEWVLLVVAIACLLYAFGCLHGCAGAKTVADTVSRRGTETLIGTGLGAGAALLAGATGVGVVVGPLVAALAVVFATPECGTGTGQPAPSIHPLFSLIQYVIFGAVIYVLWIRRQRVMDAWSEMRSGSLKGALSHLAHAFLGTRRPGVKL